eukprot:scaffold16518_cov56-Isochrysis_galbana.AAC.1
MYPTAMVGSFLPGEGCVVQLGRHRPRHQRERRPVCSGPPQAILGQRLPRRAGGHRAQVGRAHVGLRRAGHLPRATRARPAPGRSSGSDSIHPALLWRQVGTGEGRHASQGGRGADGAGAGRVCGGHLLRLRALGRAPHSQGRGTRHTPPDGQRGQA